MWDQLVVGAAPGDAITRSALLLRDDTSTGQHAGSLGLEARW